MSAVENINPEKEPVPRGWVPRVITGGKGPTDPPSEPPKSDDWLAELEVGRYFLTRVNDHTIDFELYYVRHKAGEWMLLEWNLPDGKIWDRYVNTKRFSALYNEHHLLGYHPEHQHLQIEGETNERDRTD